VAKSFQDTQSKVSQNLTGSIATTKARAVFYQLLSAGFAYPQKAISLHETQRIGVLAAVEILNDHWLELCKKLFESNRRTDRTMIELEYNRLFAPLQSLHCPPYETVYTCPVSSAVRHSQELADIAGFYRAFGVGIDETAADRPDHLSLELEFMAVLCQKEAYALTKGRADQVKICRDAQKEFLQDHLGCWVSLFASAVKQHDELDFYGFLAQLLENFIEAELKKLKAQIKKIAKLETLEARADSEDSSICGACTLDR